MYKMFHNANHGRVGNLDTASFVDVKSLINGEKDKLIAYYRNSSFTVNSTNLFSLILKNITVSFRRDIESFTMACYDEVERIAKLFNLIHPEVSNPEVRYGELYNKKTPEYIVADEEYFDYNKAYSKWKTLVPIKIRYHGYSDLNMPLLNGGYKNPISEESFAIISVNIPMLALQYRAWREREESKGLRIEHFLLKYPLINCVHRHVELALINRTIKMYYGEPVGKFYRCHPFNMIDYTKVVNDVLEKRVKILKVNNFSFNELFTTFECLKANSWLDAIKPMKMVPTRNVKWLLQLQVIPWLIFWARIVNNGNKKVDANIYNNIKRQIKYLETDNAFYKAGNYRYETLFDKLKQEIGGT